MNMTLTPAKEAVIRYKNEQLMNYDSENNRLYLGTSYHVFPSKREAKSALHNTIELDKAEGKFEPWNDYTMEEYEES